MVNARGMSMRIGIWNLNINNNTYTKLILNYSIGVAVYDSTGNRSVDSSNPLFPEARRFPLVGIGWFQERAHA